MLQTEFLPHLRVRGELGKRLELTARQFTSREVYSAELITQDLVLHPDRRRTADDYSGDLSGRYLEAVALAAQLGFAPDWDLLRDVIEVLLSTQRADGSFGASDAALGGFDHGVVWGNAFLLTGLMELAPLLDDPSCPLGAHAPEVRAATARLADSLVLSAPRWLRWFTHSREREHKFALDFFAMLLPLTRWAEHTGDSRTVQAAQSLADAVPLPDGPWHLHGYLTALRGKLRFAERFGTDPAAAQEVMDAWNLVRRRYVLAHGGVRESMREPMDLNTEGCGIADWIMLSIDLGRHFRDDELFDAAEIALHNALPHVQAPSGHFGCETLAADPGLLTADYVPEAWWCCTFHGFRAMYHVATNAVRLERDADGERVRVDLPVPVVTQVTTAAGTATVEVTTDYPAREFELLVRSEPELPWSVRASRFWSAGNVEVSGGTVCPGGSERIVGRALTWIDAAGVPVHSLQLNNTDEQATWLGQGVSVFVGPVIQVLAAPHTGAGNVVAARTLHVAPDGQRIEHVAADGLAHLTGLVREFRAPWSTLRDHTWHPVDADDTVVRFRFAALDVTPFTPARAAGHD